MMSINKSKVGNVLIVFGQVTVITILCSIIYFNVSRGSKFVDGALCAYENKTFYEFSQDNIQWTVDFVPDGTDKTIEDCIAAVENLSDAWMHTDLIKGRGIVGYRDNSFEVSNYYLSPKGVFVFSGVVQEKYSPEKEQMLISYLKTDDRYIQRSLNKLK